MPTHIEYLRGLVATGGIEDTGSLLEDFPMAIHRMLVTPTPVIRRAADAIPEWYEHSLLISQGTQELAVLAIILCQRHEQWMEGLSQVFPGARDMLEEMGLDLSLMLRVEDPNV